MFFCAGIRSLHFLPRPRPLIASIGAVGRYQKQKYVLRRGACNEGSFDGYNNENEAIKSPGRGKVFHRVVCLFVCCMLDVAAQARRESKRESFSRFRITIIYLYSLGVMNGFLTASSDLFPDLFIALRNEILPRLECFYKLFSSILKIVSISTDCRDSHNLTGQTADE